MKMTNQEIYGCAEKLVEFFKDSTQKLPIKAHFYLQKNKDVLIKLAQEIEDARTTIIKNYADVTENDRYSFSDPEKFKIAQSELKDLLTLEQDVQIYKININIFPDDINLTTAQMEAMLFMIEE